MGAHCHVSLRDLIVVQRVCKTWNQTIANSPKLRTALTFRSFTGTIKAYEYHSSGEACYKKRGLRIKEASYGHGRKNIKTRGPYLPLRDSFTPADYLGYLNFFINELSNKEQYDILPSAFLTKIISVRARYFEATLPRWMGITELLRLNQGLSEIAFSQSRASLSFKSDNAHLTYWTMYATQPPTNCMILQPFNDFELALGDRTRHHISLFDAVKPVTLVNGAGVKIGDIVEAVDYVKRKAKGLWVKVERKWPNLFEAIKKNRSESAKKEINANATHWSDDGDITEEHEYESEEVQDGMAGETPYDNLQVPGENSTCVVEVADLWDTSYFKLFTPTDLTSLS